MKDKVLIKWAPEITSTSDCNLSAYPTFKYADCITELAAQVQKLHEREKKQRREYRRQLYANLEQINALAEREMMALNKAEAYRTQTQPKLTELTQLIARQDKAMENVRGYIESLLAWQRNTVQAWEWIGWTGDETITVNKEWHEELGRTINSFLREVKCET